MRSLPPPIDLPRDTNIADTFDANGVVPPPGDEIFSIGEVLGDIFEIRRLIGCGGMGQVFDAYDRVLKRHVAIKVATVSADSEALLREAQAMAAIRHQALVAVHGWGRHRGHSYLVMERIFGMSLEDHLLQRRGGGEQFAIAEAIDVLVSISDGLAAIHRAGISHRDLKPGNIMLQPGHRVVLMDLGIFLPEAEARPTCIAGTPEYMAPEAIRNAIEPGAGHLVDLYSLGVIGFEMVAGSLPYPGADIFEIFDAHLRAPVPSLHELRPETPLPLSGLISDLLAKRPSDRPQSAEAVVWKLRDVPARDHGHHGAGALSVLIVDDDPSALDLIEACVLRAAPEAKVRRVGDPEQALQAVRTRPPHLMLLDLGLPGMSGVELCMYMRGTRLAERCTIVSVSGNADEGDVKLLRQLGVDHFLVKDGRLAKNVASVIRAVRSRGQLL